MEIAMFTFNDFSENTYILYDESRACIIIDPGCKNEDERNQMITFIESNSLEPKRLINTHCHIDHVLGNKFISEKFNLVLEAHKGEIPVLDSCTVIANMYGISYDPSPLISKYISEGDIIKFGNTSMEVLFTPGHSPASISLYNKEDSILIVGDVLFQGGIGRTDLPGGSFEVLENSIRTRLYTLPGETIVFPGHGPKTTIEIEKASNPFVKA